MRTEEMTREGVECNAKQSIPRGGPLYVHNLVGPLTSIPDFLNQLQDLKAELSFHSHDQDQDQHHLSVDDLKILQEEELVDLAFTQAFNDNAHSGADAVSASNGSHCETAPKKRKLPQKHSIDESYLEKVDELVKIKEKQDQDRATVRLHSFCCKNNEGVIQPSNTTGRFKSLRSTNSGKQQLKTLEIQHDIPVQHPEVVLCIEVYHNVRKWVKTQEFLVLGGQTLTEVRDKIYCETDQMMRKAGQHDPSGYFLVEDVFCNDLRDPSAIDYSEPIFDWLINSKDDALRKWESIVSGNLKQKQKAVEGKVTTLRLPQFRRVDMQKTRFCDLRFCVGAGYLYCHQGNCKHTIVIRDLRSIHPEDVQNRAAYPIVIFRLKLRFQKCRVCKIYRATKVTVDDKWAADNPCYFCENCYYLLHHSEDGSLLYSDFLAYDYLHD